MTKKNLTKPQKQEILRRVLSKSLLAAVKGADGEGVITTQPELTVDDNNNPQIRDR